MNQVTKHIHVGFYADEALADALNHAKRKIEEASGEPVSMSLIIRRLLRCGLVHDLVVRSGDE